MGKNLPAFDANDLAARPASQSGPDDMVRQAFSLWGPRMVLGGIDFNDFEAARHVVREWASWIHVWSEYGDRHRAVARSFEDDGAFISAGHAYRRAAACYHFAKFVWVDDIELNRVATLASVDATNRALRLLDPTHRRIEAGTGEFQVVGNLRIPNGATRPAPVTVLVPGLDSTKEEFPSWEAVFLDRGMATFAVDGPGQGEVFHRGTRIQPAYEQTLNAALEALADDPRVDMDRVVVAGTSLGGHYATRGAAYVDKVRAVVSLSGPFRLDIATLKPHSAAALAFYGRATHDRNDKHLAGLDLTGVAEKLTKPALFATGKLDRIVPWEQTEAIALASRQGTFILYEDGNHGLTNKAAEVRDHAADWLLTQVS
jgi:dienelactone hydrolase